MVAALAATVAEIVARSVADARLGAATTGQKATVSRIAASVAREETAQSVARGAIGRHGAIVLSVARASEGGSAPSVAVVSAVDAASAHRDPAATDRVTSSRRESVPQIGASRVLVSAARAASVAVSADREVPVVAPVVGVQDREGPVRVAPVRVDHAGLVAAHVRHA